MPPNPETIPLIVHLTYVLDFGGLETLLVERINRMPATKYRHAVVCLTHYTAFAEKITTPGVTIHALHKRPGLAPETHLALWKLLRRLKPTILHTYNLSAIEYGVTGFLAGVPVRVHGSHGREATDPDGMNRKHNLLRKSLVPFYNMCYANSPDLVRWNRSVIGVPEHKGRLLNNGIDTERFQRGPRRGKPVGVADWPSDCHVIGTVGRIQEVKNQALLIDAFARLIDMMPTARRRLRLAIVGAGPLLPVLQEKVTRLGLDDVVWMPGARNDIVEILDMFSVFALPSIAEGTPGAVLEAMGMGLPVVATRVGGVPDVVQDHVTGRLVPSRDVDAMAAALACYYMDRPLAEKHGAAGRLRVEQEYAIAAMVRAYTEMYDDLCKIKLQGAYKPCAE